jgi:hypothetical protein
LRAAIQKLIARLNHSKHDPFSEFGTVPTYAPGHQISLCENMFNITLHDFWFVIKSSLGALQHVTLPLLYLEAVNQLKKGVEMMMLSAEPMRERIISLEGPDKVASVRRQR